GIVATTLRHEYTHYVIESLSHGRAPRWLAEGAAAFFAGEGRMLSSYTPNPPLVPEEIERRLAGRAASPEEMRRLYAAAYRAVLAIVQRQGESALWTKAAQSAGSTDLRGGLGPNVAQTVSLRPDRSAKCERVSPRSATC